MVTLPCHWNWFNFNVVNSLSERIKSCFWTVSNGCIECRRVVMRCEGPIKYCAKFKVIYRNIQRYNKNDAKDISSMNIISATLALLWASKGMLHPMQLKCKHNQCAFWLISSSQDTDHDCSFFFTQSSIFRRRNDKSSVGNIKSSRYKLSLK